MNADRHDVLVMGGGLAGLSLAIQLRRELPQLSVCVLERGSHPAPVAAFKVGESSVEIGAHYFDTVLGLRDYLERCQLRKFGLRFFFCEGREDIDRTTELGVSEVFPTPSYQLDRGLLETYMGEHAGELGATFIDRAIVRGITIDAASEHQVRYERDGAEYVTRARWIVDASGRAGLLKRKLGLELKNDHDANAVWFRIGERICIDDWGSEEWRNVCKPPERWRSTNHLCGPGYWVWLIPLSSGSHSVGIVADAKMHPLESMNNFEKAMQWLEKYQPRVYRDLVPRREQLQDFAFLRHFSHDCKQVYSADRWAITGIAGVFLDPFYSPGSDFIGMSNTYITDLIARDFRGESIARQARRYEQLYFSFYRNMLLMYEDQYPMFGHAQWMPVKIIWDYAYYWGILCQFFFQHRLTDVALFARLSEPLAMCEQLNREVQLLLRQASGKSVGEVGAHMIDQYQVPWFGELNRGLRDELDTEALCRRIQENAQMLRDLSAHIHALVAAGGIDTPENPFANLHSAARARTPVETPSPMQTA